MKFKRIAVLILVLFVLAAGQAGATVWYAQNGAAADIDAFTDYKSTIWNDAIAGGGNWMGNGTSDTFFTALGAGDILSANGKTVHIHTGDSFTCLRISTADEDTGAGDSKGGVFQVNGAVTITANITGGSSTCVEDSGAGVAITYHGTATAGSVNYGIYHGATGACVVDAVRGGTGTNTRGMYHDSSGTLSVGDVTGGGASGAYGLYIVGAGKVTATGTVTGGTHPVSSGIYNTSTTPVELSGDLINSATASAAFGPCVYNPGPTNYIEYPQTTGDPLKYGKTIPAASIVNTYDGTGAGVDAPYYSGGAYGTYEALTPVSADYVLYGHDNYVGGDAGLYYPPNFGSPYTSDADAVVSTAHFGTNNATQGTMPLGPLFGPGGLIR